MSLQKHEGYVLGEHGNIVMAIGYTVSTINIE